MTEVPRGLVLLVAAFTSLVVLTTDVYLPVLPELGGDLATSRAAAAATVSALLVGVAVGQIVIGPVSDAVGRRTPMLLGGTTYAVVHVLCAIAPTIGVLLVLRVLGGLATAACLVVGRAVIADAYPGVTAARAFAALSAVTAIVPVVAPVAGGLLATVTTWRGMFVALAVLSALLTAVGWRVLPETLPPERRRAPHPASVAHDLLSVLTERRFLAYVAATGAVGGILFGYIGASSFLLQDSFGLSPQQYSLVFALNSVGIFAFSNLSRHVVGRVGAPRLLAVGQAAQIAGAVTLGVGVAVHVLAVVMLGLLLAVATLGLVMPAAMTLGMAASADRAGSASGVLGICQFAVGAAASPLAGLGGSPWSLVLVVGVCAVAGPVLTRGLLGSLSPRPVDL